MSGENQTLVVCPQEDAELVDQFAIAVGVLTVLGSIIGYFVQQYRDRKDAAEAKEREDEDLDRAQALARAREQLSILIGPMHRLWKTQSIIGIRYRRQSDHGLRDYTEAIKKQGQSYWMTHLRDEFLQPFIDDPYSYDAVLYRNYVRNRCKPIYTRIRELVLAHMSDLADMPPQEEWLERFTKEDVMSPHTGSLNINVVFDSYTAYTFEFDDIIDSWAQNDFRRMQPTTTVPWLVCNNLVDLLFDNAKEKEARYNKHITVHKNVIQQDFEAEIRKNESKGTDQDYPRNMIERAKDHIEEQFEKAKEAIEENMEKAKEVIEEKMGREKSDDEDSIEEEVGKEKSDDEDIKDEMGKGKFTEP